VFVAPGSAAIGNEPRVTCLPDVDPLDPAQVVAAARAAAVELVVVGPEAPLAAGVADACTAIGIAVFGPSMAAARIETSKAFCHEVAEAAGVRMARARSFARLDPAVAFAAELAATGQGVVVKADGLAAGKGVTMCASLVEVQAALEAIFEAAGGTPDLGPDAPAVVVVEERLLGLEASVIALCDGRDALALPAARDHKRLADGDQGPNTGGMGAYSPLPDLSNEAVAAIVAGVHRPILAELARRGSPFRGALYAGLILTADGPVLLECNARFGDPETQVILPRLAVPLGPLLRAAAHRELAAASPSGTLLPVLPSAAVGIVLASAGYPDRPRRGDVIRGLDVTADVAGATGRTRGLVFQSGSQVDPDGRLRTNGGRVLTVVGLGPDLAAAREAAERLADGIDFDGVQRRHDIALRPPATRDAGAPVPAGARA
ncbi:MAG TPA: phosphoribosylamine--glycine ligase, partial [Candidatus Limnocylindrales bacterium]|nr:phosphoribosylamine--glycine ligase [Candidatus Limnocylindrales bacterium]